MKGQRGEKETEIKEKIYGQKQESNIVVYKKYLEEKVGLSDKNCQIDMLATRSYCTKWK